MTDARLVATNPADSTLVPVSCNSRGELATQSPVIEQIDNDVTIMGQVGIGTVDPQAILDVQVGASSGYGRIKLAGNSIVSATIEAVRSDSDASSVLAFEATTSDGNCFNVNYAGGAYFGSNVGIGTVDPQAKLEVNGDVIVGSRSKSWMLVEQGGLCHMVEQESKIEESKIGDEVRYPHLRDVLSEIDSIKNALEVVMDKLRINPPEGWPVWDGSDTSREN